MDYIIRLVTFLPGIYVGVIFSPGVPLLLAAIPVSGLLSLVAGIAWAISRNEPTVLWAAIPVVLSHVYLGVAAVFFAGRLADADFAFFGFMAVEVALVIALIVRARSSRFAAVLVGWFATTYALAAGALGGATLTGNWP